MTSSKASPQTRQIVDAVVGPRPTTATKLVQTEALDRTLRTGRWCAVVGGLVVLFAHFFNAFALDGAVPRLDAHQEGTPLVWASTVATWTVAVAALVAATMRTGPVGPLVFVAGATAYFSVDDMIGVHERLAEMLVLRFGVMNAWDSVLLPMVYLPLSSVTAVLILRVARSGTSATFRDAVVGLCLLAAAVALPTVSAPWVADPSLGRTIVDGLEEAMKLVGWVVIASSILVVMLTNVLRRAVFTAGLR